MMCEVVGLYGLGWVVYIRFGTERNGMRADLLALRRRRFLDQPRSVMFAKSEQRKITKISPSGDPTLAI